LSKSLDMAINFSNKELDKAYGIAFGKLFPLDHDTITKKIIRKSLLKYFNLKWSIFNFKQKILFNFKRRSLLKKKINIKNISVDGFSNKNKYLNENIQELKTRGYTFIDNFFDKETHEAILKDYPIFNTFLHTKNIIKNYYYCFLYEKFRKGFEVKNLEYYPDFKKFFDFLFSEEFEKKFSEITNNKKITSSFVCTYRNENSYLIPHMDGIYKDSSDYINYNFIYFIDGNNEFPKFSSGTGIFEDNEFEKPLLLPTTLKNSCLIYKSSKTDKFFHGFDIVKPFGFGKVVTFQLQDEEFVKNFRKAK
tara:strand:- start:6671 stop:7588 length:918 start_codon:yes stop_codon:yes gene_type:complete